MVDHFYHPDRRRRKRNLTGNQQTCKTVPCPHFLNKRLASCELNGVCTFLSFFSTLENITNFQERVGQQRIRVCITTVVSRDDWVILTDKREHYLSNNAYKSLDN